jgi:hypothetical protein
MFLLMDSGISKMNCEELEKDGTLTRELNFKCIKKKVVWGEGGETEWREGNF